MAIERPKLTAAIEQYMSTAPLYQDGAREAIKSASDEDVREMLGTEIAALGGFLLALSMDVDMLFKLVDPRGRVVK